ncbi:MAG: hypothetical protein AAB574_03545 [Patescibacteria group bacterium]
MIVNRSVTVSAAIPENRLTIFGYTSPLSRVEISNPTIFSVTYSQPDGYFTFDRIIVPKNTGEYCLQSKDDSLRSTPPLCLPAPPPTNTLTDIGPIVLAPTLSLEKSPNAQLISSGQSVPNSTLTLYFFQTEKRPALTKAANAIGLPQLTTTTDSDGHFSLNLPNQYVSDFRYFATVTTPEGFPSAKSNTLFFTFPQSSNYFFLLFLLLLPLLLFLRRKFTKHYFPAVIPPCLPSL